MCCCPAFASTLRLICPRSFLLRQSSLPIPTTTQRCNQLHTRHQPCLQQRQHRALVTQRRRLHRHHIQISNQPRLVLVFGQPQRLPRRLQGFIAHHRLVFQYLQLHHVVFHFTEAIQHRLAILRHRLIVGR